MALQSDNYPDPQPSDIALIHKYCMLSGEATHSSFIILGSIRP